MNTLEFNRLFQGKDRKMDPVDDWLPFLQVGPIYVERQLCHDSPR